ncbi:MAG: MFS transporter [Microbacterium sp.]
MDTDTTGIPLTDPVRGREMLASLRSRPYRLLLSAQFLSTIAVWSQRVAVDWVLMEMTGDIALVGALVLVQFGPVLLLGMWGGVLVDRHSLKKLLLISQSVSFLVTLALTVTAATGVLEPWMMFACAGVLGLGAIVDQPARQVLVSHIVSPTVLSNAISMNSIAFQIGGMIGPAVSGILLAQVDDPWAFGFAGALHLSALGLLIVLFTRTRSIPRHRVARRPGQITAALRYAARKPEIRVTLLSLVFVCVVGLNWPVILVSMTTSELHSGADGYGLANTTLAVGSLVGALVSLRRAHRGLRTVIISVCGACSFRALCGVMPMQWSFFAMVGATGLWLILMWTAANSLLQWSSNSEIRGRIMSLYLMIAIGGPVLGWACATFGPRPTLLFSGAIPLCAIAVVIVTDRHMTR